MTSREVTTAVFSDVKSAEAFCVWYAEAFPDWARPRVIRTSPVKYVVPVAVAVPDNADWVTFAAYFQGVSVAWSKLKGGAL